MKLPALVAIALCFLMLVASGESGKTKPTPTADMGYLCEQSRSTLDTLITHVKALFSDLRGKNKDNKTPIYLKGFQKAVKIVNEFKTNTNMRTVDQFPKRFTLEKLSEVCDDIITTIKGVVKIMNNNKLCCGKTAETLKSMKNYDDIRKVGSQLKNRVLRCGFGQREQTIAKGTVVELNENKVLNLLRRTRRAADDDEDLVGELAGPPDVSETDYSAHDVTNLKSINVIAQYKNKQVAQRTDLFEVTVEHKCVCKGQSCECCLMLNHPASSNEPYTACMGIQQLTECKKKGIKIFLKFMGLETSLVIMEGSTVCYSFKTIPVSICMEPYGYHFCPRRKSFRSCLMIHFEIFGFRILSFNLHCLVIALDGESELLRLRQADHSWIPQRGAITILYDWIADIVMSQMKDKRK